MSEFHSFIESARATRKGLDEPAGEKNSPTLVYWQDEAGERSFVTEKNIIAA